MYVKTSISEILVQFVYKLGFRERLTDLKHRFHSQIDSKNVNTYKNDHRAYITGFINRLIKRFKKSKITREK